MKRLLFSIPLVLAFTGLSAQYQSTELWPNGNKLVQGTYSADPGIKPGDDKHTVAEKIGKVTKVGDWSYWFENGKLSAEEHYTSTGIATGTWKTWYANGQTTSEINFTTGTATFWFENGSRSSQGTMLPGMIQTGKWVSWHDNGQKNSEGSFDKNGKQVGTWTFWDAQGKKMAEQTYNNGELTQTKNF
ncbi:MAG: hypothetical protein FD123_2603 [Bacteroidetes bacterium]|nr:MAG: hypothetical protein FD123_2603 [Bacteroidota bacterium]